MIKWSDTHNVHKYESAGMTVNLIRRSHNPSPRQILSSFLAKLKSIFLPSEPANFTVGYDSTYRPRNADGLTVMEKFFAVAFGLGAVVLFVSYTWFLHDLDRAFRAWLAVAR